MFIKAINLQNFRNYSKKTFEFDGQTTLIVGANTVGKTNLLEAIYLLASGKSLRAEVEMEAIGYGEEVARVEGIVAGDEITQLEIILTTGSVGGRNVARKKYLVNGVSRRMVNFVGQLKAVYFGPEDLLLITGSPSRRRRYLDMVLFQTDQEYRRSILSYEKGVRQRNKILEEIRERQGDQGDQGDWGKEGARRRLYFWDQLLIKNGNYITDRREEFINFINDLETPLDDNIVKSDEKEIGFRLEYEKNVISPAILEEKFEKEVRSGMTLSGPHRDDIKFVVDTNHRSGKDKPMSQISPRDLSIFGSRGEQRLAILWLKIGELEFIHHQTKIRPILLLDDIFSELDEKHREIVLGILGRQQTIVTTTEERVINKKEREKMQIIRLS